MSSALKIHFHMNIRILWITHLHMLDINVIHSYSIYEIRGTSKEKRHETIHNAMTFWRLACSQSNTFCEKFLCNKRSDAAGRCDFVNIWSLCSVEELRRSFSTLTGWWSGRLHRPRATLSWPQRWATNWFCWAGWKRPWNGTRRQWLSMRAASLLWQVRAVWKP